MSLEFRKPSDRFSDVPVLPILDTEEYIEKNLEERWQAPENAQDREMFEEWVKFCELAQKGQGIAQRTTEEGKITLNLEAIQSFFLVTNLYKIEESAIDKVDSAKRAFMVLAGRLEVSDIQEGDIEEAKNLVELFRHNVLLSIYNPVP